MEFIGSDLAVTESWWLFNVVEQQQWYFRKLSLFLNPRVRRPTDTNYGRVIDTGTTIERSSVKYNFALSTRFIFLYFMR